MNNICFDGNALLLVIIILIISIISIFIYLISNNTNYYLKKNNLDNIYIENNNINKNNNLSKNNQNNNFTKNNENIDILISNKYPNLKPKILTPLLNELLDKRDKNSLNNPLKPPTRRNPRHLYPSNPNNYIVDIPTRGYPDQYQYYGNCTRNYNNIIEFVKLFGRQTYPGSNIYEYYGITSDNTGGAEIKFQLNYNKELFDGDEIDIDILDSNKGKWKVYLNKYDKPVYNPFIIG